MDRLTACFRKFLVVSGLSTLLFVLAAFFYGPGLQMQPKRFTPSSSPEFYGPFTVNSSLESAQRLFEKQLYGSESMTFKDGIVYVGLNDGRIVKISNGKMEPTLTRIGGNNCHMTMKRKSPKDQETQCGFPVGMRLMNSDYLVVADFNKGIYKVSTVTGAIEPLIPITTVVDGKRLNMPNDLVISTKGDIYFTDSGSRWPFAQWGSNAAILEFAESAPNGRILHYDPETKKVRTVVERLYYPNGIQLTKQEDALLFSQTTRFNIMKFHLHGAKKGQLEVLVDNLPGLPDNIRPSGRSNSYWVALAKARIPGELSFWEYILPLPWNRRITYSTLVFAIQAIDFLKPYIPFPIMDVLKHEVEAIAWGSFGDRSYGLVFEMKEDGTILRSLHSPRGRLNQISQVLEANEVLYFSSSMNDYIGKYKLHK